MQNHLDLIQDGLTAITTDRNNTSIQLLTKIFVLLSQFFALDTMYLPILDLKTRTLTFKAFVINRKVMLLNEVFHLSDEAIKLAEESTTQGFFLVNNSNQTIAVKQIANQFKVKASISLLSTITPIGVERYAGLTLAAYGENRYQDTHVNLIMNLPGVFDRAVVRVLDKVKKESCPRKTVAGLLEVRNSLEHQRIDLTLNSQHGLIKVINQVEQVGPLESPVLITGETGVGKEIISRMLHGVSTRADGPLVAVNCGALPESLLDSELFGFEKGAFTGAMEKKTGYFEQADKGTLFLDEVGELPMQAQTKLLRVLQHQTFQRVGGSQPVSISVRVIAATNRNIPDMIQKKYFREDLWYRLNVFPIEVPPLRERRSDIPILVQYLINSKLYEMNLPFEPRLAQEALAQLMSYDWPGNIRELQNVLERALILCKGAPLAFPHLASKMPESPSGGKAASFHQGCFLSMDQMIVRHIYESLKFSKGKIGGPGGAAELLGMHPSTLRARMKKLNIQIKKIV